MADRYWVGGTDNWNTTAGTKWATTSGGVGGAAVPTTSDDVFFDSNSGAVTVTVSSSGRQALNLDFTGFTGTFAGSQSITIASSLFISTTTTWTQTGTLTMSATTTGKTITLNGKTIGSMTINGVSGGWTLQDDLSMTGTFSLTNGNFDANDKNITLKSYSGSNSNTRVLSMGNGTWIVTGDDNDVLTLVWNVTTSTNFTLNCESSTVKFTKASANQTAFAGGGLTWNNVWFDRGTATGLNTITGSNTFNDIKDTGTAAHTMRFSAGITTTTTTFAVSGSVGNLISINSSTTATHALVKSGGGTISCDYLNIQHSVATPATTWYAGANSTNNQADADAGSGWIFTIPPAGPANLKSLNTNVKANIKSYNTNVLANIKSINTNA